MRLGCRRPDPRGPQASAIASMATGTPAMSAPKRTIARAGFGPGKNSAYASFISLWRSGRASSTVTFTTRSSELPAAGIRLILAIGVGTKHGAVTSKRCWRS